MRTALSSRVARLLFKSFFAALFAIVLAFSCSAARAGDNADGLEGDHEYDPEPGQPLEAVTIVMKDGGTYDIGTYNKATWLVCNTSGAFTVRGQSAKTMLVINAAEGMAADIIFDNARLVATKDCPGAAANARSAIEIKGSGGTVTLLSAPGSENYFRAKGGRPCIRKDNTGVRLVFSTVDEKDPGLMEVHADPNAHCTCAIGCYGSASVHRTFGNCVFQSGQIQAYGSAASVGGSVWYGGAAIGADEYSAVDGITFENAEVYAEAGSASAAGIGTTSCYLIAPSVYDRAPQPCSNITVNGGALTATHKEKSEDSSVYGGAGIGGGWGGSCDHITINGGTVTALGSSGAAGIGGGRDGDGMDIVINGGTVYAQGGSTGIGGGEASGYICGDDSLRFGDCRVTINGGDITAIGGKSFSGAKCIGVGIGGWKEKFYYISKKIAGRMTITINGGNILAEGNSAAAIGSGEHGNCRDITISGGVIQVHTAGSTVDIGGYGASISTCESITITGGTISNTEAGKAVIIGGGNPESWNAGADSKRTNVYISGGNVHGKVYGEDHARLSSASDTPVYPYEFCLGDFALSLKRGERVAVSAFETTPGISYVYGLNDTFLLPSSIVTDPVMYAWLPEGITGSTLTTDPAFIGYTYGMRKEDVDFFSGNVRGKTGNILYPRLWFLFDDNYSAGDLTRDSASYYIGQKKAETIHNETVGQATPAAYSLDPEGSVPLLKPDGTYFASVTDPVKGVPWTDAEGKMILEPRVSQNYYINGINLYSVWPVYDLKFDANKPAGTEMPLSGNTADITDIDPEAGTVLPSCGFELKNYVFTGWNTKADGSGKTYLPGNAAKDLKPATGRVTVLYAQWEPAEYSLTYDPGDGAGTRTSVKYAIDRPGAFADPEELGFSKADSTFLGWTTGALGNLYPAGEEFVNMCGFDEDGNIRERTLTARWELALYPVTFEMSGHGIAPDPQIVERGGYARRPSDPSENGWFFGGWYTDDSFARFFDFDAPVTQDTVIYAKWTREAPGPFTVSFNMGGHGARILPQTVKNGETVLRPEDPSENRWRFTGWYTDAALAKTFDFAAPIHSDTEIFAGWTADPPKTGDDGRLLLWMALLPASAGIAVGIIGRGKRKKV